MKRRLFLSFIVTSVAGMWGRLKADRPHKAYFLGQNGLWEVGELRAARMDMEFVQGDMWPLQSVHNRPQLQFNRIPVYVQRIVNEGRTRAKS